MAEIHQFVATFAPWDATGNHTVQVQRLLRELGHRSEIWVEHARREVAGMARPYTEFPGGPSGRTWLLYQASTGSPVAEWLLRRPEPKLVNYHNVTPAHFFAPWEPHVGVELRAGRRQVRELAPATEAAIADSAFNEAELRAMGYVRTSVVPILLDTSTFDAEVDRRAHEQLRSQSGDGTAWLFVGRLAPHKGVHDLIKAFAVYRQTYDPQARLRIVGGPASHSYLTALHELRNALSLQAWVDMPGDVPDRVRAAHYRAADVYVSLSDHEGFCIPVLEAMHYDLPVVAFAAAAVPETLGGAGVALPAKPPTTVAAAVHRVVTDRRLRAALVAAGRRRLGDFDLETSRRRFADAVAAVVG